MRVHRVVRLRPPTNHRLRLHQHRRPFRSMGPNVCSRRTIAWDVTSALRADCGLLNINLHNLHKLSNISFASIHWLTSKHQLSWSSRHDCFSVKSVAWRLAVGYGDQLLTGKRSHSPTSRFPSSLTPVVITEPFPDRTGSLRHMSKEMWSDRQWNVCLQPISRQCHTSLTPALWPNLTVVYTLHTKQLLIGWRYMAHTEAKKLFETVFCRFFRCHRSLCRDTSAVTV